jgi:CheY-like chemotaxis protein
MNRVVLIVDDDPTFCEVLRELLVVECGVEVVVAADADTGLQQMRALLPGLVLLDYKMPQVDGLEFCRLVRAEPRLTGIPIVAVTAWGPFDAVRAEALAAGCVAFLAKPFRLDDLLAIVGRWLPAGSPVEGA